MDIEKRMESVVESWKKRGELLPLSFKPSIEILDTAGENIDEDCKVHIKRMFMHMFFSSIDVVMENMSKEVKKGIVQIDWNADEHFSFIEKYLNDFYDSEGELI